MHSDSRHWSVVAAAMLLVLLALFSANNHNNINNNIFVAAAGTKTKTLTKTLTFSLQSFTSTHTATHSATVTRTRTVTHSLQSLTPTASPTRSATATETVSVSLSQTAATATFSRSVTRSATLSSTRSVSLITHTSVTGSLSHTESTSKSLSGETPTVLKTSITLSPTLTETASLSASNSSTESSTGVLTESDSVSNTKTTSNTVSPTVTATATGTVTRPRTHSQSLTESGSLNETRSESVSDPTASESDNSTDSRSQSPLTQSETWSHVPTRTPTFTHELTESGTHIIYPAYNSPLETANVIIGSSTVLLGIVAAAVGGSSPVTVLAAQRVQTLATFRKCRRPDPEYSRSMIESPTQLRLPPDVFGTDPAATEAGAAVGNTLFVGGIALLLYLAARWKMVSKDRNRAEAVNNVFMPVILCITALALWQPTAGACFGAMAYAGNGDVDPGAAVAVGLLIFLLTAALWIFFFVLTMWHTRFRPTYLWKRVQSDEYAQAKGGLLKKGDWDPLFWHCVEKPMPPPRRTGPENPLKVLKQSMTYRSGEWRVEDKVLRGVHKPSYIAMLPSVDRGARPLASLMSSPAGSPGSPTSAPAFENAAAAAAESPLLSPLAAGGGVSLEPESPSKALPPPSQLTRCDYFWWRNAHDAFFFFVTDRCRWFIIVEWAVSFVWAICNTVARAKSCTAGGTFIFLPMLVYIVLLIWRKPFAVGFDNLAVTAIAALQCVCLVLVLMMVNVESPEAFPLWTEDTKYVRLTEILLLVVNLLILLMALADIYRIVRAHQRDKQRKLDEERAKENAEREREDEERRRLEEEEEARLQRLRDNPLLDINSPEWAAHQRMVKQREQEEIEMRELLDEVDQMEARLAAVQELNGGKPIGNRKFNKFVRGEAAIAAGGGGGDDDDDDDDADHHARSNRQQHSRSGGGNNKRSNSATGAATPREADLLVSDVDSYDSDDEAAAALDRLQAAASTSALGGASPSMAVAARDRDRERKLRYGNPDDEMDVDDSELAEAREKTALVVAADRAKARAAKQHAKKMQELAEIEYDRLVDGGRAGTRNRKPPRPLDPRTVHRNANAAAFDPKQSRHTRPKKLDDVVRVSSFLWDVGGDSGKDEDALSDLSSDSDAPPSAKHAADGAPPSSSDEDSGDDEETKRRKRKKKEKLRAREEKRRAEEEERLRKEKEKAEAAELKKLTKPQVEQRLTALLQKHEPNMVRAVPALMQKYQAKEWAVLAMYQKKYANAAAAAAASASAASSGAAAAPAAAPAAPAPTKKSSPAPTKKSSPAPPAAAKALKKPPANSVRAAKSPPRVPPKAHSHNDDDDNIRTAPSTPPDSIERRDADDGGPAVPTKPAKKKQKDPAAEAELTLDEMAEI